MVGQEYTTIHIETLTDGQAPCNVYDVYRIVGSCIVVHWKCMEEYGEQNSISSSLLLKFEATKSTSFKHCEL